MNLIKEFAILVQCGVFISTTFLVTNSFETDVDDNVTPNKEKVSVLLSSAILFHDAAKTIEEKLFRLKSYKPYEDGMKIVQEFNEKIAQMYLSLNELKLKAEKHHNSSYITQIRLLKKVDAENKDLVEGMKLLANPSKYYDENKVVQIIKEEKLLLSEDLKSFKSTAKEFMKNVDALEENGIYLYTLEESELQFDRSVLENLLEMYKQAEEYQDQISPFGENIPKHLTKVDNSVKILTQIEIPTYIRMNGKMLENFVPSIIKNMENTEEKYASIDALYDQMFTEFMEQVTANQIKLKKFLQLVKDMQNISKNQKTLEKIEL